jgi:hypothetical protein
MAEELGRKNGIEVKCTTDAKYLEVGFTTKSDNVDYFLNKFKQNGLSAEDCCFWGDEFGAIADGIWGSDSQMLTPASASGNFFDVSETGLPLPNGVTGLGGGVNTFREFLRSAAL